MTDKVTDGFFGFQVFLTAAGAEAFLYKGAAI